MLNFSFLWKVRLLHRIFAVGHLSLLGAALFSALRMCSRPELSSAVFIVAVASGIRLLWMLVSAVTQCAVASAILAHLESVSVADKQGRKERRIWYARWLWLGRFGLVVTVLQLIAAAYLTFSFVNVNPNSIKNCDPGSEASNVECSSIVTSRVGQTWTGFIITADGNANGWHYTVFLMLTLGSWIFTVMQCCTGSDIVAWSSLYARHSQAWGTYYHDMFDYGIREALCCFGRVQYMYVSGQFSHLDLRKSRLPPNQFVKFCRKQDDDEVNSVAAVLGDLVSYVATGASHLDFLAGLALLQQLQPSPEPTTEHFTAAPVSLIEEATILHSYAVAAYTGPLLDIGRNPFVFLCVWIYRQGMLAPWKRHRQPKLNGDNWWRGHAAAFLRFSKLPPEALRNGRVSQGKRECAYFVVVVHHLQCVVVAVRGTESPEDLLTDGLGRNSLLEDVDLGFLGTELRSQEDSTHSIVPRFAHEGIVDAARELALQLDNFFESPDDSSNANMEDTHTGPEVGLLTSLLGPGGECEGYALRFVGHSLGGSIAAVTALRLRLRYPQLRVYGYGVSPCMDAWTASACSSFVTRIIYNDEFSSRLSVSSVKRLRVAAVKALAAKSEDMGMVKKVSGKFDAEPDSMTITNGPENVAIAKELAVPRNSMKLWMILFHFRLKGGICLCSHACRCIIFMSTYSSAESPKEHMTHLSIGDPGGVPPNTEGKERDDIPVELKEFETDEADGGPIRDWNEIASLERLKDEEEQDLVLPGLVVHIVPVKSTTTTWRFRWRRSKIYGHQALVKDRKDFQDIVVSPSMFLDHMPWRCQHALNSTLQQMKSAEKKEAYVSSEGSIDTMV